MKEIFARVNNAVDGEGWVNLVYLFGEPLRNIPKSIREPFEGITHCNTIVAMTNDPACDFRSGAVAGVKNLAPFYGVGEQQFRRYILPHLTWMKWLGNKPITNVNSVTADAAKYLDKKKQTLTGNFESKTTLPLDKVTKVNGGTVIVN